MAKRLRELSARHHSPRSCAYHYLNMARRNHAAYLQGDRIRLKKYLYVLRPLLAVRWIESGRGIVPMEFERLVEAMVEDPALRRAIDALLARKRSGSELGQAMAQLDAIERRAGVEPRYDTAPARFRYLIETLHERAGQRVVVLVTATRSAAGTTAMAGWAGRGSTTLSASCCCSTPASSPPTGSGPARRRSWSRPWSGAG